MKYLGDEHDHYLFGCLVCRAVRVITKPATKAAMAQMTWINRQKQQAAARTRPRRAFSFPRGKP
jgi:hypothetical protein